ncbi:MAG: HD domain-containing protein, partial [Endomicrobia bacterium]|nr:HD domain-containing protein [Endomicrobiia bacterium]
MKHIEIPGKFIPVIDKIAAAARESGFDVYAVGGFVRDIIIGREPKDLDIMAEAPKTSFQARLAGVEFAKILAAKCGLREPVVFERFGTAKLFIDNEEVEFVMPRKEYYEDDSRNPDTEIGTLEQDALRRDFTINALFLRLSDMHVLDLTGMGLADIESKTIRVTDPPNADIIFSQDPLRILRAIRQSLQLGFKIETGTFGAMKKAAKRINIVSPERVRDEINKILAEKSPSKAFLKMDEINLTAEIFPELERLKNLAQPPKYHSDDVYNHTLKALDRVPAEPVLRMAALLHDLGKFKKFKKDGDKISFHGHETESAKEAEAVLKRLKYSKDFISAVSSVIENHMYPKNYSSEWKDSAVRRFAKSCGAQLAAVLELEKADYGKDEPDEKIFDLIKRIENMKASGSLAPEGDLLS